MTDGIVISLVLQTLSIIKKTKITICVLQKDCISLYKKEDEKTRNTLQGKEIFFFIEERFDFEGFGQSQFIKYYKSKGESHDFALFSPSREN